MTPDTGTVFDVVVLGAGQAGLSAAFHLQRTGLKFTVLDAEIAPGGAWRHRWESLTMETVNGIFDLPGMAKPPLDPQEPSREAIPRYFAEYERQMQLPVQRPVRVTSVARVDEDAHGLLEVETDHGVFRTRAVVNSTGTWTNPVLPQFPGAEDFLGRQLHTRDYTGFEEFAGQRVAVVGGGISAVQHLEEISRVATTMWFTRRPPVFHTEGFRPEVEGRATIEKVTAAAEAGKPTASIVSYTGLGWTDYAKDAHRRGALERRPMFTRIEPHGVREADGSFSSADVILWATGFRPALGHLAPLELFNELGGIKVSGTEVVAEPRVHLVGFGPSQSTVGANRAGRDAVRRLQRLLTH
ncbi:NAD(P)/FAD-dependent oxidoreductase [Nesterenkonia sp. MY13]|uniref:NAD(P)/FAD-dependent oxidoreductase n=1 Tax=Nesterenkonia sedimenti TaxID=1463632 RepID=A0A7X8TJX2_9MICC|nr:FAD-dependent oxidoreductase [Nesterenkonia sedimenti]NLS09885.1 NAD(P)/FAD-dependent oxidoreductase [Nesterenkonia sedimenti]